MRNVTKSTNLLKKYIKEKFAMQVSAKSEFYTGGSSLRIKYDLGLCVSNIECDLSRLKEGRFDGMTDSYDYKNDAMVGMRIENTDLVTYKYIFVDREISAEFRLKVAKAFFEKFRFTDVEKCDSLEDLRANRSDQFMGYWTLGGYIWYVVQKMNFLTNNENDIEEVFFDENANLNDFDGVEMFYKMNGQTYSTRQIEIKKTEVKREKVIVLNDVRLVDYSEKAIAVIGNTYEIKEQLKSLGGKYNKFLTIDEQKCAGWVFSKTKTDEISDLLIKYSEK